ncbi:MAG: single-stranded DNA-binding protein [Ignavibacteriales bacterium]|nr:MAG: single-stranded DNA-binding protein [Ignavibacteriales bacterium]
MAFSLNKIQLIGNLGQDAETRTTTTQVAVTNFSVATENSYKNKDGEWVRETTWHRVTYFNASDFLRENLRKGSKVYVEGRYRSREYTDKDNIKKTAWEVIAEQIIPLSARGNRPEEPSAEYNAGGVSSAPPAADAPPADADLPF